MQADLIDIHFALLSGDPIAPARLVDAVVIPLTSVLRRQNLALPREMIEDAATDALLDLITRPDRYDSARSSLLNFLLHIASNKLIDSLRSVGRRRETAVGGLVELELYESNNLHQVRGDLFLGDFIQGADEIPAPLLHVLDEVLTDPVDRRIARLIANGRTETADFAAALGISHLSATEQPAIVKRHRDRILKRLQRNRHRFRTYIDDL